MAAAGAVPAAALPMATVAAEAVAAPSLHSLPPPPAPRCYLLRPLAMLRFIICHQLLHIFHQTRSFAYILSLILIWFLQHYLLFVRSGYRLLPLMKSLLLSSPPRGITTSSTSYSVALLGLRFEVLFSAALQQFLSLMLHFFPLLLF